MKVISNKHYAQLNILSSTKQPLQSDFRVHFTIMNVFCHGLSYQILIQQIASKINQNCFAHILQISNIIDQKHVDVSIGLYNDIQALKFLKGRKEIQLFDNKAYSIIVSRGFQSYIKKYKAQIQSKQIQPKLQVKLQTAHKQKKDIQIVKLEQTNRVQVKEEEKQRYRMEEEKFHNRLWLFGIPVEYTKEDVLKVFQSKNMAVLQSQWMKEDIMEFLQIVLQVDVSEQFVDKLSLKIQGFPFVTIPGLLQRQKIMNSLLKYQMQFTASEKVSEEEVIVMMDKIGGVNILLKNDFRDEQCYTVVFNNQGCIEKLKKTIGKDTKFCQVHRQQFPVRVGRLNKIYTFQNVYLSLTKQKL